MEDVFRIYKKKYSVGEVHQGATPCPRGWGARPTPWARPTTSWAPWWPSGGHLLLYEVFQWEKISSHLLRRNSTATRQNLGGINLGLRRSCSAGETSLREGEIIAIVITNAPLIGRGSISINMFTSTISSQTLVHLLYPIFVPKPQIGICGLLVVLITPCS